MSVNTTKVLIRRNLQKRAQSVRQLADTISVTPSSIRRNLNAMREAQEVYISGWTKYFNQGPWMGVYSLGKKANKPSPAAVSDAERMRRRRRNYPDAVLDDIVRKRKARAAKKAAARVIKAKAKSLNLIISALDKR